MIQIARYSLQFLHSIIVLLQLMSPVTVAWAIQQNKGVFGNHRTAVIVNLIDSNSNNLMYYATKFDGSLVPPDLRQNILCYKPATSLICNPSITWDRVHLVSWMSEWAWPTSKITIVCLQLEVKVKSQCKNPNTNVDIKESSLAIVGFNA